MESTNTFTKMIMDLDKSIIPESSYYKGINVRPITTEGLSSNALVNIQGNEFSISIPDTTSIWSMVNLSPGITVWGYSTGNVSIEAGGITSVLTTSIPGGTGTSETLMLQWKTAFEAIGLAAYLKDSTTLIVTTMFHPAANIVSLLTGTASYTITTTVPKETNLQLIGWESLNSNIYLITTPDTSENPGDVNPTLPATPTSTGQIWKLEYNEVNLTPTLTLLYNNYLNLTTQHPIANPGQIVARYENQSVQKLYWTEYFNRPRMCNLVDPNLFVVDVSIMTLQSSVDFSVPKLDLISSGGILQAGVYQFGYRLKNTNGSETTFSQLSHLVHVVNANESTSAYPRYECDPVTKVTGKKIHMTITGVDTDYQRIEIVRIYFNSKNDQSPVIDIIYDDPIPSNGIYPFIYTGYESPISVTLNELLVLTISFTKVKSLVSKNNILFYLNTIEENFDLDYDARAFRWRWNDVSPITTGTMNWVSLDPETGNDINPNQSPDTDATGAPYLYKKPVGGALPVLGGEGTNISYEFVTESINLDNHGAVSGAPFVQPNRTTKTFSVGGETYQHTNMYESFMSPYIDNLLRAYQRDETYRFGIVFFNKQGQSSFVKWIADIRMPHMWMPDPTTGSTTSKILQFPIAHENAAFGTGSNLEGKPLGIKFNVNIPANISYEIEGFSIVRLQRTQNNKTVLGQGLVYPVLFDSKNNKYHLVHDVTKGSFYLAHGGTYAPGSNFTIMPWVSFDTTYLTFKSPDFLFTGNPKFNTNDSLDLLGRIDLNFTQFAYKSSSSNPIPEISVDKFTNISDTSFRNNYSIKYNEAISSYNSIQSSFVNGLGDTMHNISPWYGSSTKRGAVMGNRSLLLQGIFTPNGTTFINTFIGNDNVIANNKYGSNYSFRYLANYKRNITNQYGGNTLSQKSTNEYISCGHYQKVNTSTITQNYNYNIFGGDTYITMFDIVYGFKNWVDGSGYNTERGQSDIFPVETTVNTDLRIGTLYTDKLSGISYGTTNKGNIPDNHEGIDIEEEFNLAEVYNSEPIIQKYFPKPIPFALQNENTNRIYASDSKLNGELEDSWSNVKSDTAKDVNGQYGPITNGIINNDKLFFFQESGIGIAAINERALLDANITTQNVELGASGVLSRYDYISTTVGSKHQHAFATNGDDIYFFDIDDKTIYKYGTIKTEKSSYTGLVPISDTKLISSYLKNRLSGHIKVNDNPVFYNINTGGYRNGILLTYDNTNKEVFFTFLDAIQDKADTNKWTENNFTLVFNESADAFTSFYSHFPAQYINTRNKLISPATTLKKWQFSDNNWFTGNALGFVSNNGTTHNFIVGDKIQILQFPVTAGLPYFAQYNTTATVVSVPNNTSIITDQLWLGSTNLTPGIIINVSNNDLYIHNIGDYGKFYNQIFDSQVTFISNKYPADIKTFNNMELFTNVTNKSVTEDIPFSIDIPTETFTTVRYFNDYQNTDFQQVSNISKRVERKWNLQIPSNRVLYNSNNYDIFDTGNISSTRKAYTERMRDNHLFVDLLYNNINNYKLTLHHARLLFEKSYS